MVFCSWLMWGWCNNAWWYINDVLKKISSACDWQWCAHNCCANVMTCSKFYKWLKWQWWTNDWCVHEMFKVLQMANMIMVNQWLMCSWHVQSSANDWYDNGESMTDVFMKCSQFCKWLMWQWWTNDWWCVHDMIQWPMWSWHVDSSVATQFLMTCWPL